MKRYFSHGSNVFNYNCTWPDDNLNLEVYQLDVKTNFLHGDLEEENYMEQLEGFVVKGKENLVFHIKKELVWIQTSSKVVVYKI